MGYVHTMLPKVSSLVMWDVVYLFRICFYITDKSKQYLSAMHDSRDFGTVCDVMVGNIWNACNGLRLGCFTWS